MEFHLAKITDLSQIFIIIAYIYHLKCAIKKYIILSFCRIIFTKANQDLQHK